MECQWDQSMCEERIFWIFFNETDADIFCIQESKMQEGQLDLNLPGYHQYWNYAEKKRLFRHSHFRKK